MDRSTETTAHHSTARIARAAWLCAFVVPAILSVLLLGVKSAQAAETVPVAALPALEEELLEGESEVEAENEAEFAEAECEIAKEEAAEGEITAAEAKAFCEEAKAAATGTGSAPGSAGKCALRSAHAHAVIHHDHLKLTIGYTSSSPTAATVEVRSGPKHIASVHRHLGKSGVLRITKKLGSKRIKQVTVSFKTPSCGKLRTKSVKVG